MFLFWRKQPKDDPVYKNLAKWLDDALSQNIPENVEAFCFNLYDDGENGWSMELVGTQRFDTEDADWPCDEVTAFGTRKKPYVWQQNAEWNTVQEEMTSLIKKYLAMGKHAKILTNRKGVGIGFVDGDITLLYSK